MSDEETVMNFSEFSRSGTAPTPKVKVNSVNANVLPFRPKTRSGEGDLNDFNIDLRNNKINGQQFHDSDNPVFINFRKGQEGDDYVKALESFQAAVEDWSGQKDFGQVLDNKRPESRNRISKDPKKTQNLYLSGLSAYTQNVPNIVLQTSKKSSKIAASGSSPRVREKVNNNHISELRAAYGADFGAPLPTAEKISILAPKPKIPKPSSQQHQTAMPSSGAVKFQEESVDATQLRSSSAANRTLTETYLGVRPQTQSTSLKQTFVDTGGGTGLYSESSTIPPTAIRRQSKKAAVPSSVVQKQSLKSSGGTIIQQTNKSSVFTPCQAQIFLSDSIDSSAVASNSLNTISNGIRRSSDPPTASREDAGETPSRSHGSRAGPITTMNSQFPSSSNPTKTESDLRQNVDKQLSKQVHNHRSHSALQSSSQLTVVSVGAATVDERGGLGVLERPQSRKLYLGNDKGDGGTVSVATTPKPTIKAPRSAGARYSNFSPTRRTSSNAFEDSDQSATTVQFNDTSRQTSLKKMSSFSSFQQTRPWREEDHLPVRRPPSRQSSAFPVHLADLPDSVLIEKDTLTTPKSRHRKEEVYNELGTNSPPTTNDQRLDRPPSRQKLAAQHLFEGLHRNDDATDEVPDESDGAYLSHVSEAITNKNRLSTSCGGRGRSAVARTGLFYNPRDDGFSELLDTNGMGGSLLPFSISVNYGEKLQTAEGTDEADFTVVMEDMQRYRSSHNIHQSTSSESHRRVDSGSRHCGEKAEVNCLTLSGMVSEVSLISLSACEAGEGIRRGQAHTFGGRPASNSWDFNENSCISYGDREPVLMRPKTVMDSHKSGGQKSGNNGNYSYSQTSHSCRVKSANDNGCMWTTISSKSSPSPPAKSIFKDGSTSTAKPDRTSLPLARGSATKLNTTSEWTCDSNPGGKSIGMVSCYDG